MFRRISVVLAMVMLLLVGVWASALAQTEEEMLAIHQAQEEAFNAHDVEQWLSYLTDDAIHEYVPSPPPVTGKEEMGAFMTAVFQAFPDGEGTTQQVLFSENVQVLEWVFTGTLEGQWLGMGPTGQGGPTPHLTISEYEGGKIKRLTTYFDVVTFMVNSALMPPSDLPPLEPSFELPDAEPTGLTPLEADAELVARWRADNLAHWTKMLHPDVVFKYNTVGMLPLNREQTVAVNELFAVSNSTLHGEIVRQIDVGDGWVATEAVWPGVHDGPYFGIPASGRPVEVRTASLGHYDADGLVTEFHFYFDNLGVLVQIGAVPAPGPSSVSAASWGQIKSLFQE